MTLILENTVNKQQFTLSVTDLNNSRMFYAFSISLPSGITDGQYEYTLKDENEVKATGLLQIGDFENNNTETYTTNESGYKEYNSGE